jgi:hypothetical protein
VFVGGAASTRGESFGEKAVGKYEADYSNLRAMRKQESKKAVIGIIDKSDGCKRLPAILADRALHKGTGVEIHCFRMSPGTNVRKGSLTNVAQ